MSHWAAADFDLYWSQTFQNRSWYHVRWTSVPHAGNSHFLRCSFISVRRCKKAQSYWWSSFSLCSTDTIGTALVLLQILFLSGITLVIGPRKVRFQHEKTTTARLVRPIWRSFYILCACKTCLLQTVAFFARRNKLRGTACFMGGILLVFLRYPFWGMLIEMFGFLNLFGWVTSPLHSKNNSGIDVLPSAPATSSL